MPLPGAISGAMDALSFRNADPGAGPIGLVLLASLGGLAAAFAGEYLFGLEPCILCLYERVPYAAAALMAGVALATPAQSGWRARLMALAAVVFLAGAGLAFYHVGVEQHWWRSVAGCEGPLALDAGDLGTLSLSDLKPCDRVDWRLFGLSLAAYNAIVSLALAALCLVAVRLLAGKH